ncbi:hypothetical protein AX16_009059 [Volvariella volvacea WC 439]|nr:hypothetical protein AX16_009059 [Volvariella volvacea WC 439]
MTSPLPRRVPLNADVIEEVLSHFSIHTDNPNADWRTNDRDLFNIALTCRQFKEPALSALWHSLDSLDPLLCLLPQIEKQGNTRLFNGARPKLWTRFDYYARRVREFRCRPLADEAPPRISPFAQVCISKARGFLLRNLHSLFFDLRSAQSLHILESLLPALLEPTIQKIVIWNADVNPFDIHQLLSVIRFTCENVQFISIHGHASNFTLNTISSFPNLQQCIYLPQPSSSTAVSVFPLPFLNQLSQLPRLQELNMDLIKHSQFHTSNELNFDFTSLKRLSLYGNSHSVTCIIKKIQSVDISDLNIRLDPNTQTTRHIPEGVSWDQINSLMLHISGRWSHSISSLKFHLRCSQIKGFSYLEGLVTLLSRAGQRIRSFQLLDDYNKFPPISHTQVWDILKSNMPKLSVLNLPCSTILTLAQIHELLPHLPCLESLGIAITLDGIPPLNALAPLRHNLKTLSVGQSHNFPQDQRQTHLAFYHLYRMAPKLSEVRYPQSDISTGTSGQWAQLQGMLILFRTIDEDKRELSQGNTMLGVVTEKISDCRIMFPLRHP